MLVGSRFKGGVYNLAAPGANTPILPTPIIARVAGGILTVGVVLATASVLNLTETDGTTAFTHGLNSSNALSAGDFFAFTIPTIEGHEYNFEVETDGIIRRLAVHELGGGQGA